MVNDLDRARDALHFLDAGCDRETWHKTGRAAIAAGLSVDELDTWSSTAGNYAGTRDVQAAFRTIKPDGGTGAGTLFHLARDAGWGDGDKRQQKPEQAPQEGRRAAARASPRHERRRRVESLRSRYKRASLHRAKESRRRALGRVARGSCW